MYILGFVIGTILGSLVKALADRSLTNRSFWGRSYCPYCKRDLHWYDLFPMVSYILLQGKCRYCHKSISIEYLLVEVVMGILVGYLFFQGFDNFPLSIFLFKLLHNIFFIVILGVVFLTDLKKMLIYDRIILPALLIGFLFNLIFTGYKIGYLYFSLSQTRVGQLLLPPHSDYFQRHALLTAQPFIGSLISAILIGAFFWGLIVLTRGKGMGGGDVKLGAFMGLMLGFPASLVALISAFFIGALVSLILVGLGKKHFGQTIAFAPFLVMGSLIALFWGQMILDWYLKLSS